MYIRISSNDKSLMQEVNHLKKLNYEIKTEESAFSFLHRQIHTLARLYPEDYFIVAVHSDRDIQDVITYLSDNSHQIPLNIRLFFAKEHKTIYGTGVIQFDSVIVSAQSNDYENQRNIDLRKQLNEKFGILLNQKYGEGQKFLYRLAYHAQVKWEQLGNLSEFNQFINHFAQLTDMLAIADKGTQHNLKILLECALIIFKSTEKNSNIKNFYRHATLFSLKEFKVITDFLRSLLDVFDAPNKHYIGNRLNTHDHFLQGVNQVKATHRSKLPSYVMMFSFIATYPLIYFTLLGVSAVPSFALPIVSILYLTITFIISLSAAMNLDKLKRIQNTKDTLIESATSISRSGISNPNFFRNTPVIEPKDENLDASNSNMVLDNVVVNSL